MRARILLDLCFLSSLVVSAWYLSNLSYFVDYNLGSFFLILQLFRVSASGSTILWISSSPPPPYYSSLCLQSCCGFPLNRLALFTELDFTLLISKKNESPGWLLDCFLVFESGLGAETVDTFMDGGFMVIRPCELALLRSVTLAEFAVDGRVSNFSAFF